MPIEVGRFEPGWPAAKLVLSRRAALAELPVRTLPCGVACASRAFLRELQVPQPASFRSRAPSRREQSMKSLIALIMTELALAVAVASGCGGSSTEKPDDALASPSSSGSTAASDRSATRSAEITESRIPVTAKSRGDVESRRARPGQVGDAPGCRADAIGGRANRTTALVEVSIGKDPNRHHENGYRLLRRAVRPLRHARRCRQGSHRSAGAGADALRRRS